MRRRRAHPRGGSPTQPSWPVTAWSCPWGLIAGWCPCQQPSSTRPTGSSPGPSGHPAARTFFLQASAGRPARVRVSSRRCRCSVLADRVNDLLDSYAEGAATEPVAEGDTEPLAPRSRTSSASTPSPSPGTSTRDVVVIECHDQRPREEAEEEAVQTPTGRGLSPQRGPGLRPTAWRGRRPPAARPARSAVGRSTRPATSALVPTDTDADPSTSLTSGDLTRSVGGRRLVERALLCSVEPAVPASERRGGADAAAGARHLQAGGRSERPLWDYPDGTLVARSGPLPAIGRAPGGFDVVPPTVLRNGPLGPGSVQLWVGARSRACPSTLVDVVRPPTRCPAGGSPCSRASRPAAAPWSCRTRPRAGAAHRGGVRRRAQQLRPQGRAPARATATSCCGAATTGSAAASSRSCAPCSGAGRGSRCRDADLARARDPARRPSADGARRRARRRC